ncbi:MAG: patatin-like phospholipase family protein [Candidatus Krumholzibacteriia bacterium]
MNHSPRLGLALGSGGARGLAHAGVLDALEEAGLRPHLVAGTSMGSIVGALYCEDPSAARVWPRLHGYCTNEEFASYWATFVPRDHNGDEISRVTRLASLFDHMQRKLVEVKTVTRLSVENSERLRRPLLELFGEASFADLEIPFAAVAMDLITGKPVVFRDGGLVDAVYASSAIPAVFPPLESKGMLICDGGGPYRVPVEACRALGADVVVAVDIPAFDSTRFSTGLDLILRSNAVARQRLNHFVCATADVVIRPSVGQFHWADFRQGTACRARGYAAARDAIPELQKILRDWTGLRARLRRRAERHFGLGPRIPLEEPL